MCTEVRANCDRTLSKFYLMSRTDTLNKCSELPVDITKRSKDFSIFINESKND